MNIWQEAPQGLRFLDSELPQLPVQLVIAGVSDRQQDLYSLEQTAVARAVTKRRNEFSTGRWCARHAISLVCAASGTQPPAEPPSIPQGPNREPLWPEGFIGSITHTDELASAALARAGMLTGLGHDLERQGRLDRELWKKLFTDVELGKIRDDEQATVLFSAKESIYKAVNPLVGDFIGFQEAELCWNWEARRFQARYLGDKLENRIMRRGQGWFWTWPELVLTLFVIPLSGDQEKEP